MASFRKRGSTWEYRIRFTDPQTGKRKEKTQGGFQSKKEAQIIAGQIEKEIFLGNMPILKKNEISVEQWLNEWMETYGFLCEDTTLVTRENYINNQIIPSIGNYKLNKLTRMEYQKHLNSLSEIYAKTTVQTIHSIFCTAINKAVELELLQHNNFLNMKVQKDKEIEKRNYLTRDEVSTFIRTAKKGKPHHYLIVSFLLRTGLRKGELLALKWQDIDFEKKLIVISKSRNDKKVKKPKTPSSFRTIPIGDKLIKDLLAYKDWQKQNKDRYGEKYIEQDYVITTWNGRPLGPYGINKVMKTIIDKTDLPKISPHGLRHTHAIMMLESGNDIKVVSERLGHSALNVTSDVYLHITKKHEMESVNRLEKYLEGDEEDEE